MWINLTPGFIKGRGEPLLKARIPFDKPRLVWHASTAADKMRRIEQRSEKSRKGLRRSF